MPARSGRGRTLPKHITHHESSRVSCCFFLPSSSPHPAMMDNCSFGSFVWGYHVCKDIWQAHQEETLPCRRESRTGHDPFAIGVVKNGIIEGHVPRRCSAVSSLFLRSDGQNVFSNWQRSILHGSSSRWFRNAMRTHLFWRIFDASDS